MAALMRVLREREMAGATQPHRIAGPTMPIQHVVNSWARDPNAEAKAERARERAEKERFARKPLTEKLKDMEELFNDPNFEF
jgi:hypothetical protein